MAEREHQSAATAAAEQVRTIVEAAERSAREVESAARAEAERIRAEAERDASQAREAVARIDERADELNRRLDELSEAVRTAVAALKEELAELRGEDGASAEPAAAGSEPGGAAGPEPGEDGASAPGKAATPEPSGAPQAGDSLIAEAEAVAARESELPPERAPGEPAPEGARVLALKMALDGAPREETARYLRENFELDDPAALLDEVYSRAGR